MNYPPWLTEAETNWWVCFSWPLSTAGSSSLQLDAVQFEEKKASKISCTDVWVTWQDTLSIVVLTQWSTQLRIGIITQSSLWNCETLTCILLLYIFKTCLINFVHDYSDYRDSHFKLWSHLVEKKNKSIFFDWLMHFRNQVSRFGVAHNNQLLVLCCGVSHDLC